MSAGHMSSLAEIDGRSATRDELAPLAFAGFAHFTAMQVRNRRVKGLDLHLTRLRHASVELFSNALPDELVRDRLRSAIDNIASDQSLTATIFSPRGEFTSESMNVVPEILVRGGPPSNGPPGPLRLSAVEHIRPLAAVKHVGEVGKTYYLHRAIRQGFDDAVFVDQQGRLTEGTIWNIAFWDGETVIWPLGSMLRGTMMGIVQRQLARLGIPQRDEEIFAARLGGYSGAAVMNSWSPGIPVSAIATTVLPKAASFIKLLHEAFEAEPSDIV